MLTTSERIKLITEVSRRLAAESWSVIDLTLRQFGLPTSDDWRGDTGGYVLAMIERAGEETLVALAGHVGIDTGRESALEPTFWVKGHFRLFLSHVSSIKRSAGELQAALAKYGISAFVAHNDIEPTEEWQDEIELALATCDAFVALLTPDFHASKWTDQELGFAMGCSTLVVTVQMGQDPYGFIGRFQAITGRGRPADELAQEIFDIVLNHKQTRPRVKEALVSRFEQSSSFQAAREAMGLLERVTEWPEPLKLRIRAAVRDNYEVAESFTVPDRVKKLVGT